MARTTLKKINEGINRELSKVAKVLNTDSGKIIKKARKKSLRGL